MDNSVIKMSTASGPRLPQELLDLVIENLQDDKPTIFSCSLASKSLLPITRKLMFRSVFVDTSTTEPFLSALFTQQRFIATSIRHLTIANLDRLPLARFKSPIFHLPQLTFLRLPNLDWEALGEPLKYQLLRAFPALKELEIIEGSFGSWKQLASLLCAYSVERLCFYGILFKDQKSPPDGTFALSKRLRKIIVDAEAGGCSFLLHTSLPPIEYLHFKDYTNNSVSSTVGVLRFLGSNLHHLVFEIGDDIGELFTGLHTTSVDIEGQSRY